MVVELISVGTEILMGNILNSNTQYLAEKCALLGLSCYYQSVVGDNEERLEDAIDENTILVSLMQVNNEAGTIMPVDAVKDLMKKKERTRLVSL